MNIMNIIRKSFKKRGRNERNRTFKENKKMLAVKELTPVNYHFVIGSSEFLLKNEPLEEMLRERAQFCKREGKPITFWLVKSPKFLNSTQLSDVNSKLLEAGLADIELTAIISVNKSFITWLKLRIQNVAQGSFVALNGDIASPLSSNCAD